MLLSALQERNERLFYRTVIDHIEELLPVIYTPTGGPGRARRSRTSPGSRRASSSPPEDRGQIASILGNWPEQDIHVIVVTMGNGILGPGLTWERTAWGSRIGQARPVHGLRGIPPRHCLPVMLDVGTNDPALLADPLYLGYPHRRLEGEDYFTLVEEFVMAVQQRFPNALIQFEDFLTPERLRAAQRLSGQGALLQR
jgi:malate dehydrogenase (oxaloacetate-decarboxylating)(NADP+)